MLMKLTEQQIREARIDLAAVGFRAAITNLVRKGMHESDVIPYLSRETKNIEEVFIQAKTGGVPNYLVGAVLAALKKKGVIFYKHQLSPTYEVVESHAYHLLAAKKQCS